MSEVIARSEHTLALLLENCEKVGLELAIEKDDLDMQSLEVSCRTRSQQRMM
jgi:hypothetical protein